MSSARLTLTVALIAGCGGSTASAPPPAPVGNTAPSPEDALVATSASDGKTDGALWSCQISDYDPQPCRLERAEGGWYLRKLMGSQRFKGTVTFAGETAFDFAGSFFCPWGDCTSPMTARFDKAADGGYTTSYQNDVIRIAWDSKLASEWGGAGYGGLSGED
jgi:hypothetical protein